MRQRLQDIRAEWDKLRATMADQGFDLAPEAVLVPFVEHRCVVCTSKPSSSVVLSVADSSDAIVYGDSLKEYLSPGDVEILRILAMPFVENSHVKDFRQTAFPG